MLGNTFFYEWEVALILFVQAHLSSFGIFLLSLISELGEEIFLVIIIGLLYWGYDKKIGNSVAINVLFAGSVNCILKNIFVRRRPYFDDDRILCLKKVEVDADTYDISSQGFSFPSGHATNTSSLFVTLYTHTKNKLLLNVSMLSIVSVGISRFALGVHYPTDVLFGSIEGMMIVLLINKLMKYLDYHKLYIILSVVSFFGIFFCKSNDYFTSTGLLLGYVCGIFFEERFVNFKNTKSLKRIMLRTVFGVLILLIVSQIPKFLFTNELLAKANAISFFIRFMRYFLAAFVSIGLYPHIFKYFDKE